MCSRFSPTPNSRASDATDCPSRIFLTAVCLNSLSYFRILSFYREFRVLLIKPPHSAVPSPNGNIGIWTFKYWGLSIWGILNTSLTGITINVIDPGHLSISYPTSSKIAVISGKTSGFINSKWNEKALKLMAVDKNIGSSSDEIISFLYGSFTQEILRQLRSLKSGGTLIFIPENVKWEKTLEKPISYKSLKPFNGIRHIENALESELKAISTGALSVVKRGMELIGSYEYKAFITEAARSIAHMAAVDGGTVLRKNFDVLAFGAKVDITQKRRITEEVVIISPFEDAIDSECPLNYAFKGKRHLSAARYVIKNPGTVAFVISQDGGVTGFKIDNQIGSKTQHKLLAYKELEILM